MLTVKKKGKNNMEMCSFCKELRNMVVSSSTRIIKGDDNKEKKIKTLSYHCEKCHQFVKSEDQEVIDTK
jgi:uncharacterized protein YggU (UPF0235/DUF167 family)